jgi:hydrogenase-4 component B
MNHGIQLLLTAFGLLISCAFLVFILGFAKVKNRIKGWIVLIVVLAASVIIISLCGKVMISGESISGEWKAFYIQTLNASLHFTIDRLSAFFMLLVILLAFPAVMFSIGYMEREKGIGYYSPLLFFITGMLGVVCIVVLLLMFIPWEFMSLSAYALILFQKEEPQSLQAGLKYFIVTHFGTTCMFIGGIILYNYLPQNEASFLFPAISKSMGLMMDASPAMLNLSLVLVFIGFATKAGLFPFGFFWLPDAHPAAPSPISALLSGVMIKIGIYGIIRFFLFLLPPGNTMVRWGWIIAGFGTMSLFFGTIRAMMQHDSKILLAYHSIGQIGYITLGLGLGMIFLETYPLIALLGMVGGLYHLLNHTCFKGLLFLNAGAVIHKTGQRDMDKLGGMAPLLPVTAVAALIAVMSIGGLPGFSGFVSKWILYESSIMGGLHYPFTALMGVVAIFIGVVTLVSVVKFYASMFLGHRPDQYRELIPGEDMTLKISQLYLAVLCILLGIFPALGILPAFSIFTELPVFSRLQYGTVFGDFSLFSVVLHSQSESGDITTIGVWNPLLTMAVFLFLVLFGYLISRSAGAKFRTVGNWYCGSVIKPGETIYHASSYYLPLKQYFALLNVRLFPARLELKADLTRAFNLDRWFYYPFTKSVISASRWFARSHVGIPQVYLLWTVIGAVITITMIFWLA